MLDAGVGAASGEKERAQRFEMQMPVRYRVNGDGGWHEGVTRNVSRSGVLFQGEGWAEPSTSLEMAMLLPCDSGVDRPAEVVCRGMVMRSERGGSKGGRPLIAIKISHYRLVRP